MSFYVLINSVTVGAKKYLAGYLVDDVNHPKSAIEGAGGFLWPVGTPEIDAAGALARQFHSGRGADESALNSLMSGAAQRVLRSTSSKTIATAALVSSELTANYADGATIFVATVKSWFVLDKASTATADGITVLATDTGTGRWVRTVTAHPSWTKVGNWYINATTGNDENDGQSSTTTGSSGPLKTHAELERRVMGSGTLMPPVVFGAAQRSCSVSILTDLPNTDPINIGVTLPQSVSLRYAGIPTTLYTGSVTAFQATTASTNTQAAVTDSGLPAANTWTSYLGARCRITTAGARLNTIWWVGKDLGAKQARVVDPVIPYQFAASTTNPYLSNDPAFATPQVGDAYVIESLPVVSIGTINVRTTTGGPAASTVSRLAFGELNFRTPTAQFQYSCVSAPPANGLSLYFYACSMTIHLKMQGGIQVSASNLREGAVIDSLGGYVLFTACLFGAGGAFSWGLEIMNGRVGVGKRCYFQDGGVRHMGGIFEAQSFGVFDVTTTFINGGHGVVIGRAAAITAPIASTGVSAGLGRWSPYSGNDVAIYGSGSAGAGIFVGAGSSFNVPSGFVPTITGSTPGTNDFVLNSGTTSRAWDEAGGAYSTARTNSWTNFAATIAGGGFGGSAHNVQSNAHIQMAA